MNLIERLLHQSDITREFGTSVRLREAAAALEQANALLRECEGISVHATTNLPQRIRTYLAAQEDK